ncbi:acyl-CoA dehydrogenase family protein [Bacillus sp. JCM 19034]|uniref:acyl-CoA dehydrogenase family protein n=1 Tax=Bacillus sp. JCM 19034 TaxID=1481928 RepID=UPI000780AF73|nr:acyl-CoA dehydrogenase family protein [Bacillus sp. JCM 19034]
MLLHNCSQKERKEQLRMIVKPFMERASRHDEDRTFPFENINELKAAGYPSLSLASSLGGKELSLTDWLELQEIIATADGSTSLAIGWHIGITSQLHDKNWPEPTLQEVANDIVQNGALLNAAATEPETGSPTRGGKPTTKAHKTPNGWLLSGRKSFTSMIPALDYILVSATTESGEVGNFLVKQEMNGVSIDETWDTLGMRGTASHDLVLTNVEIPDEYFVETFIPGKKDAAGWLLHIPACYLGIAQAAQNEAIRFAKTYSPNSLNGPIKDIPAVQTKIGENEADLMQARHLLYAISTKWDLASKQQRMQLHPELAVAKYHVVHAAQKIVDRAMRVAGAHSLYSSNPLQRYYRDVRAGLHNPPMDDRTIQMLALTKLNSD